LPGGARRELKLNDFWQHKGRLVMKFAGVDSISQAEELTGAELQIAHAERATLEAGDTYVADLIGCVAVASEGDGAAAEIGTVGDVIFGAGEAPLLIIRQESGGRTRELMIPFAEEYIGRLDLEHKRIEMRLPEGMLELDAPLSAEEKQDQQRKH